MAALFALESETKALLEEFVCLMYSKSIDEVRAKMFHSKFSAGKMYVDLMLLPPITTTQHIDRASYVANLFSKSKRLMVLLDDSEGHGWGKERIVKWTEIYFPDDVSRL